MKLAITGAPGSGKTQLAQELAQRLPELTMTDNPTLASLKAGAFDCVLLMGLDLPQASTLLRLQADAQLRSALNQAGVNYAVVYGQDGRRLQAALRIISPQDEPPPRWTGVCEKCSDPDCERRTLLPRI